MEKVLTFSICFILLSLYMRKICLGVGGILAIVFFSSFFPLFKKHQSDLRIWSFSEYAVENPLVILWNNYFIELDSPVVKVSDFFSFELPRELKDVKFSDYGESFSLRFFSLDDQKGITLRNEIWQDLSVLQQLETVCKTGIIPWSDRIEQVFTGERIIDNKLVPYFIFLQDTIDAKQELIKKSDQNAHYYFCFWNVKGVLYLQFDGYASGVIENIIDTISFL